MKLIFFDVDGTLIGDKGQILAQSTKEAIGRARDNGHICVVNTGRTWRLVGGWLPRQAEFDGYLLGCGTAARYHGEVLWHRTFSGEQGRRIVEALEWYSMDVLFEGNDENYTKKLAESHTEFFRRYMEVRYHRECGTWEEVYGRFDKFLLYTEDKGRLEGFRQEFARELSFIDREGGFWEVLPAGCSKGLAMEWLAEALGIPMADTVAVGDSNNDLEMLQRAGTGIAMGNAAQGIRDLADYVTTDVMADGIRNALDWLGVL